MALYKCVIISMISISIRLFVWADEKLRILSVTVNDSVLAFGSIEPLHEFITV